MHEYGGFEQTSSIGHTLPSADIRIDVVLGDIVFYIIQIKYQFSTTILVGHIQN